MAHTASATHGGINLTTRIADFITKMKESYALRAEFNRTYSELQGLTDRELHDIGVRRCDISDIARDHVYCS